MYRDKKSILIIFIIVGAFLASITVAYALLQTSLNVTVSSVTQQKLVWNIGFEPGTVTGSAIVNSSGIADCGTATVTATTISGISPSLSDVNDECAYTFTLKNSGDISGIITNITIQDPTGLTCTKNGSTMVCGDITYKLRYDSASSNTLVAVNDTISPRVNSTTPTTRPVILTIKYTGQTAAADDFTQSGFSYSILFSQN